MLLFQCGGSDGDNGGGECRFFIVVTSVVAVVIQTAM